MIPQPTIITLHFITSAASHYHLNNNKQIITRQFKLYSSTYTALTVHTSLRARHTSFQKNAQYNTNAQYVPTKSVYPHRKKKMRKLTSYTCLSSTTLLQSNLAAASPSRSMASSYRTVILYADWVPGVASSPRSFWYNSTALLAA